MNSRKRREGKKRGINKDVSLGIMGRREEEEGGLLLIVKKGGKWGGEMRDGVVKGSMVWKGGGWEGFDGVGVGREKVRREEIEEEMKEVGVEMEMVGVI